jgi:hypothetical protein
MEEIGRIEASLQTERGCTSGIGSGKLLDTAKAVGAGAQVPVILVPTMRLPMPLAVPFLFCIHVRESFLRYLHHEKGRIWCW